MELHAANSMCGVLLLQSHPLTGLFLEGSVRIVGLDWFKESLEYSCKKLLSVIEKKSTSVWNGFTLSNITSVFLVNITNVGFRFSAHLITNF